MTPGAGRRFLRAHIKTGNRLVAKNKVWIAYRRFPSILGSPTMGFGKKPIADLPANVSVYPIETSKGYRYWRVLVGKRFTCGEIISKNFRSIQAATKWIFVYVQKLKS